MTGGQTTIDTNGSAAMQSDTTSGASAAARRMPRRHRGRDGDRRRNPDQCRDRKHAGRCRRSAGAGPDNLTTLRETLSENQAVTDALEAADHTTDDVIALHRDGQN